MCERIGKAIMAAVIAAWGLAAPFAERSWAEPATRSSGGALTPATRPADAKSQNKFLRFVEGPNGGGELQASIVTYRNANGATVDLIAAVHVADADFFQMLDRRFATYDALLYEMVKPRGAGVPAPGESGGSWVSVFQRALKETLRLEFQLDAIDYGRPNFVHADLDAETFLKMQEERGESILGLMLQSMLREMMRPQPAGPQPDLFSILAALRDPEGARQLKMMLAKQFERMDDLIAGMEGPNGSVLLTERNKAAVKAIDEQLAKGKKNLGLFYGAAHLKGIEQMLQRRGFRQAGEPKWLTAWDMHVTVPATRPGMRPGVSPGTRPIRKTPPPLPQRSPAPAQR